jgi:hypothetical protein
MRAVEVRKAAKKAKHRGGAGTAAARQGAAMYNFLIFFSVRAGKDGVSGDGGVRD